MKTILKSTVLILLLLLAFSCNNYEEEYNADEFNINLKSKSVYFLNGKDILISNIDEVGNYSLPTKISVRIIEKYITNRPKAIFFNYDDVCYVSYYIKSTDSYTYPPERCYSEDTNEDILPEEDTNDGDN